MSAQPAEQSKLKVSRQVKDGICYLAFSGDIDEDFTFDNLLAEKHEKYLIDFNEVEMINSCGIREWINLLEKLGEEAQIIYMNCPQIIIQQMNMVEGFLTAKSRVHTFYGPYYCEECDKETKFILKSEEVTGAQAPEKKCGDCGEEMEFDAHEKQYFHFLNFQS